MDGSGGAKSCILTGSRNILVFGSSDCAAAADDEPLGFDFAAGRALGGAGPATAALRSAGTLLFDPVDWRGVVPVGVCGGDAYEPRP